MPANPNSAVDTVYHSDWGRIVATLIRFFGDFDIAEEAAQEAFAAAVDQWRTDGVPEFPRAWIIQTAPSRTRAAISDCVAEPRGGRRDGGRPSKCARAHH